MNQAWTIYSKPSYFTWNPSLKNTYAYDLCHSPGPIGQWLSPQANCWQLLGPHHPPLSCLEVMLSSDDQDWLPEPIALYMEGVSYGYLGFVRPSKWSYGPLLTCNWWPGPSCCEYPRFARFIFSCINITKKLVDKAIILNPLVDFVLKTPQKQGDMNLTIFLGSGTVLYLGGHLTMPIFQPHHKDKSGDKLIQLHAGKLTWNPKSWRWMEDDFPFQLVDFQNFMFQPLISLGVYVNSFNLFYSKFRKKQPWLQEKATINWATEKKALGPLLSMESWSFEKGSLLIV